MKPTLLLAAGLGALVTCLPAQAELKFSGYVEGELRLYPADGILKEQKEAMGSLAVEPELAWKSEDENHRLRFKPFARYSDSDGHRDHADIRELFYTYSGEGWQLTAGIDKVYWGVVESLHAVDIINQTDVVESVNGEQKLGQPMIAFGAEQAWGNLDLYLLPWFRERRFPEGPERFRLSLNGQPIQYDKNSPLFDSHEEEKHIDSAVRWKKSFGTLDLALSYFNGTHRDAIPVLVDVTVINPVGPIIDTTMGGYYEQMEQSGLELQYLYDSWAFKLEGSYRNLDSGRYTTVVSGFEYTLSDLQPWGADLGILVEYLWNNRQEVDIFPLSLEALPAGDKALLGMLTPNATRRTAARGHHRGRIPLPDAERPLPRHPLWPQRHRLYRIPGRGDRRRRQPDHLRLV
jgi:hypothetical protein